MVRTRLNTAAAAAATPSSSSSSVAGFTFKTSEQLPRTQDTRCFSYVKDNAQQKLYQEFEDTHQKRLLLKRGQLSASQPLPATEFIPSSYLQSPMNSRPPTGVDLALGLNGFSSKDYPVIAKPQKVPTSMQPLDDRKHLRLSADLKTREEEERRFAEEAEVRQVTDPVALWPKQGDGLGAREETSSRQLDRIVAKDWVDHQVELTGRRQEEDKLQNNQADSFRIKQDGDRSSEVEGLRLRKQQQLLAEDLEEDLNNKLAQRLREQQLKEHHDWPDKAAYGEATKRSSFEDEAKWLEEERNPKNVRRQDHLIGGQMVDQQEARQEDNSSTFPPTYRKKALDHEAGASDRLKRDILFERERQALTESAHRLSRREDSGEQRSSKGTNMAFYHHIRDQIKEHEAAVLYDRTVIRRKAEEARLEEELEYKNSLMVAKEKKAKDAEQYRKFLLNQMEEKQKLGMSDALRGNKVFRHHRMLAQNKEEDDDDTRRHQVDMVKEAMAS